MRGRRPSARGRQGGPRRSGAAGRAGPAPEGRGIGETGLDYFYDHARATVRRRASATHIEAARQQRPAADRPHPRRRRRHAWRCSRRRWRAGRSPASSTASAQPPAGRAGGGDRPPSRHRRHPDLQALGRAARHRSGTCRWTGCCWRPTRPIWRRCRKRGKTNEPAYTAARRRRAGRGQGPDAGRGRARRRPTIPPPVRQGRACRRRPHEGHRPRLRHLGRRAADRLRLRRLPLARPAQQAPCAARSWSRGRASGSSSTPAPICASSASMPASARIDALIYTHAHADHIHGIDDLRAHQQHHDGDRSRPTPMPACFERIRSRFPYAFQGGQAASSAIGGPRSRPTPFDGPFRIGRGRGRCPSPGPRPRRELGLSHRPLRLLDRYRRARRAAFEALAGHRGLDRRCAARPAASEPCPSRAARSTGSTGSAPRQAYLTHMNHEVDYADWAGRLPPGVLPAHDGLTIELPG